MDKENNAQSKFLADRRLSGDGLSETSSIGVEALEPENFEFFQTNTYKMQVYQIFLILRKFLKNIENIKDYLVKWFGNEPISGDLKVLPKLNEK